MKTKRTVSRCALPLDFRVKCPVEWHALSKTDDASVRHCGQCKEPVHLCATDDEAIAHAIAGHCIAREQPDESELPVRRHVIGRLATPPAVVTDEQHRAAAWAGRERGIKEALASESIASQRRCPECQYPVPSFRVSCYVCGHRLGHVPERT